MPARRALLAPRLEPAGEVPVRGLRVELALAPIAGTHALAPFRVTIVHMLGNIVVRADRFETAPRSATTGRSN